MILQPAHSAHSQQTPQLWWSDHGLICSLNSLGCCCAYRVANVLPGDLATLRITINRLNLEQRRQDEEYSYNHRGRSHSRRRGSHYGDFEYGNDRYDRYDEPDDYDYDHPRGRSRSRHRARSLSRPRSYGGGFAAGYDGYAGTPYPAPGVPLHHQHGYPGQPAPYAGSGYAGSAVSGMVPGQYPGAYSAQPYPTQITYPGGSVVGMAPPMGHASSTSSGYSGYSQMPSAYPMATAPGVPMGAVMSNGSVGSLGMPMGQAPPQTIVIHRSRRHKHRRDRSRSHGSA